MTCAAKRSAVACGDCALYSMCRLAGLGSDEPRFQQTVSRRRAVEQGSVLLAAGEPCRGIYAVHAGAFKTSVRLEEGEERVLEFHLPGEIIGLESLTSGRHQYTVTAIEPSSVCRLLPEEAARQDDSGLHRLLVTAMGDRIGWGQWLAALAGAPTAEQRVATFLMGLSSRYAARGLSACAFRLPMKRQELASHLGLALETVSRVLKRLQRLGLITTRGRFTEILREHDLARLAGVPAVWPPAGDGLALFGDQLRNA